MPWKRVFRLGLLLQSGAPFDRSSKSWFVLVRIVGPDHPGTLATAETATLRSSVVGVRLAHSCVGCTTACLTQQHRRPSSTVGRPTYGQLRGVIYPLLPLLRLDVLVLLHSLTCIFSHFILAPVSAVFHVSGSRTEKFMRQR